MLKGLSVSTNTGIPVVPTLVSKISSRCGSQRDARSSCSVFEMNFVRSKEILPELISFTDMNGMPLAVYLGVECVPSVSFCRIVPSLHHSQLRESQAQLIVDATFNSIDLLIIRIIPSENDRFMLVTFDFALFDKLFFFCANTLQQNGGRLIGRVLGNKFSLNSILEN